MLNGTGSRLSEGFDLENGRYRVEIEMAYSDGPDYIAISLHYPDGNYDLLYNESDGEVFASAMARNRERGECFLEVGTSTVEWKVGISPL